MSSDTPPPTPGVNQHGDKHGNIEPHAIPAIEARGLGRRYGRTWALSHIDLNVQAGESLLLVGANGSGKTTLLRLLAGTAPASAGELRIFGFERTRQRLECRRLVSMVSHENYLYDRLTAYETVRLWAKLLGYQPTDELVLSALEEVALAKRAHDPTVTYSAGMKKRLTLVRTKLEQPRVVLLDEPMSALDADGKELVCRWIDDHRRSGRTVVFSSHAVSRARQVADRILHLDRGQELWQGRQEDFSEQQLRRIDAS
jgi:heme ABC exporter ATP-binding subunit CcmA